MKTVLNRAPIARGIKTSCHLDVTAQSSKGWARRLAPPWELVMELKHGRIDEERYEERYGQQLAALAPEDWARLYRMGQDGPSGVVTLLCYCGDGVFCHTHQVISYALKNYPEWFEDGREVRYDEGSRRQYLQWVP